jgi:hypothetical protein
MMGFIIPFEQPVEYVFGVNDYNGHGVAKDYRPSE